MISAHPLPEAASLWWAVLLPPAAGLGVAGMAYALGLKRLGRRRPGTGPQTRHAAAFYAGLALLAAALLSPLDRLSERLFSAHMVQHLVIVLAAGPLLVYGRPRLPFALATPLAVRRWFCRRYSGTTGRRAAALASSALTVGALHAVVLWVWHLPGPYQAAVADRGIHAVEHFSFLLTGYLFWRLVVGEGASRRLGYLPSTMLVLATALQSCALGVILSFANYPLYPVHSGAADFALSAIEDQQLAGAIMWVPAGGVYFVTIVILMARMFAETERRMLKKEGAARPVERHADDKPGLDRPQLGLGGRR